MTGAKNCGAVATFLGAAIALCSPFLSSWAESSYGLLQSVSGNVLRSIEGSSRRSIEGSSRRSIEGSSRRSIEGSSRRSIEGSSRRSIEGSSRRSIEGSSQRALADGTSEQLNALSIYGPISGGVPGQAIEVMGQSVLASGPDSGSIDIGRSAYVEAELIDDAWVVTSIEKFDDYAIPGATPVFVHGTIGTVDATVGRVAVGDLIIDLNGAQINGDLAEGLSIVISGTQPTLGGLVLAETVLVSPSSSSRGESGGAALR